ncbi:type II toxin-antitoxin system HigB family toxin [Rosenbergiella nectarea]|uniref:type II toxin-antitoxin system HigB family toxin n=1 Tax=Rosenbergiella nectarea TaxID=988801 RepID=UPI001F4F0042|nr:type II toxin-antitoxin system HigB family toxin [Rosenbergiella nectarea]
MRLINKKIITDFYKTHPQSKSALEAWCEEVAAATWSNFHEVKARYASADNYDGNVIFDINGNNNRLVVNLHYVLGIATVKWIGTHAEYDKKNRKGGFKL